MHRVSVEPFLERWGSRTADKDDLAEHFDVSLLGKCYSCQACKDDCPVCKVDISFKPTEIIGDLVRGDIEKVLQGDQLWKCLECYTCQELCHSDIGMADTFRKLKERAIEAGSGPESVTGAYASFLEDGVLGKPRASARKKLGLAPLPATGGDAVAKLMKTDADVGTDDQGDE
jgi:heterodisulfide reductase subunit C